MSDTNPKPSASAKSKFRQESKTSKPSDKLRRDPPPRTSGQVDPKPGDRKKPLTAEEKETVRKKKAAAKEDRQIDKSKFRAEKNGKKLDNAREKLANQKPVKPPGAVKTVTGAAGHEVAARIHGKIHEVERDNPGLEAAHKAEIYGEHGTRATSRFIRNRNRTRPARRVRKMEKKNVKANAERRFREMAKENPELKQNALKRHYHKKRVQKQFQKQANEAAKKAAKKTGKETASLAGKAGKAVVNFVKNNPKVIAIIAMCLLLVVIVQSCAGMVMTLFSGFGSSVAGGISYLAEDEDIDEVELRYTEWEIDLLLEARNTEITHTGYDEYIYSLDTPGHDPYALLAYLTAKHDKFTYSVVQAELHDIFSQQYTLTFTPTVEIRTKIETHTRTETRIGTTIDGDGNEIEYEYEEEVEYEVEVEYEWHILTVMLTARSFTDVISPMLTTQEQQERYAVYLMVKGNRQYVENPIGINWLSYVSSGYGYRISPIDGTKEYHTGVDIALPVGTPIKAGGAGKVLESGNNSSYGLAILINYGNGITARYAHCSQLNYTVGQTVKAGEIIALSGDTGTVTGPHLHAEVIKNGRYISPFFFMHGTVDY